jgi:hypothetical protein
MLKLGATHGFLENTLPLGKRKLISRFVKNTLPPIGRENFLDVGFLIRTLSPMGRENLIWCKKLSPFRKRKYTLGDSIKNSW